MGFSALLLSLGIIPYRQADFPFAVIELAVATPIAIWWLVRLWRQPTIATLLAGYALTLLAFLFFGRYFQGNYLGFIAAVFTPVPFLAARRAPLRRARRSPRLGGPLPSYRPAPSGTASPSPREPALPPPSLPPAPVPVALDAEPSPVGAAD